MANDIVTMHVEQTQSPFDSIRRFRADGSEYWSARELMVLLGYRKWERFGAHFSVQPSVIQRAMLSAKASQTYTESQLPYVGKLVSRSQGGSVEQEDCELSRYACYLVGE